MGGPIFRLAPTLVLLALIVSIGIGVVSCFSPADPSPSPVSDDGQGNETVEDVEPR